MPNVSPPKPMKAGEGQYNIIVGAKTAGTSTDVEPLTRGKHYIAVDAVSWFLNRKSSLLTELQASGTLQMQLEGEQFEVGLGTYDLNGGVKTAPIFDKPVLGNRQYQGRGITLRCLITAIKSDALLGSLLRGMALASLEVVAGAVTGGVATAAGSAVALTALTAAGTSLAGGIKEILANGKKKIPIFDQGGAFKGIAEKTIVGPETYVLIHRGNKLDSSKVEIKLDGGQWSAFYDDQPLSDGAWVLIRIRRELAFGVDRPWSRKKQNLRADYVDRFARWASSGLTKTQILAEVTPSEGEPSNLADRTLSLGYEIATDTVLAEREATLEAGKLRAVLRVARAVVAADAPSTFEAELKKLDTAYAEGELKGEEFVAAANTVTRARMRKGIHAASAKGSTAGALSAPGTEGFWHDLKEVAVAQATARTAALKMRAAGTPGKPSTMGPASAPGKSLTKRARRAPEKASAKRATRAKKAAEALMKNTRDNHRASD